MTKKKVLTLATLTGSIDAAAMKPRERLAALRDFLRTDAAKAAWAYGQSAFGDHDRDVPLNECSTAACALGWWDLLADTGENSWVSLDSYPLTNVPRTFGITKRQADALFTWAGLYFFRGEVRRGDRRVTPSQVAKLMTLILDGKPLPKRIGRKEE